MLARFDARLAHIGYSNKTGSLAFAVSRISLIPDSAREDLISYRFEIRFLLPISIDKVTVLISDLLGCLSFLFARQIRLHLGHNALHAVWVNFVVLRGGIRVDAPHVVVDFLQPINIALRIDDVLV